MVSTIIIVILSLIIIVLSYNIFNLIRQAENAEDYSDALERIILDLKSKIGKSYSKIKNIDRRGSFEADDEIGFIFKDIKSIINDLYQNFESKDTDG
jgi:predicted PurR-regulated permease PerM